MKIKIVTVGFLRTNCYILENDLEALIIDPGDEPLKIEKSLNKKLAGIILTHHHDDHVNAAGFFKDKYKTRIYDYYNLKEGINKIGIFSFKVIHTPGHTIDSITVYFEDEKIMFVGDFVFHNTIGRTDLEGGNWGDMKDSINNLMQYDDIKLYPGHGIMTILEEEKNNNVYFR